MTQATHHIGTSGWSYAHWGKGRFYPPKLNSGEWFSYYARFFPTVEINLSFYRIPQEPMVDRWVPAAPPGFLFALKLWRGITHLKKLAGTAEYLDSFLRVAERLGETRGPLLVQLPPRHRYNPEQLDGFLGELRDAMRLSWRVAVEFRNPDWLTPEIYDLLDRRDVALCLADMPKCMITRPNNVGFIYMRRHGSHAGEGGRYTDAEIAGDAGLVRGWLAEGRDVFVYYNNDWDGHAVDNARQLISLVREGAPEGAAETVKNEHLSADDADIRR
jgi:uncharacterized protein YecE (DUF72 family)